MGQVNTSHATKATDSRDKDEGLKAKHSKGVERNMP